MTAVLRAIALLLVFCGVAVADAPSGYKCGPGGYRVKDSCRCPDEKQPARDKDGKAICEPKPEPAPTACLADRKGKHPIKVESTPVGATIYIGSKSCGVVGQTPWTGKLAAGPVIVILEHQSYDSVTRTVTMSAKSTSELFVPMQRTNAGAVEVRGDSDPNVVGVAVTVDGQAKGNVPVTIKLPVGRHLVEMAKPGFDAFQQWVDIQDGQTMLLLPVLRPIVAAKGNLVIDADVPQAEVFVNGERKGTTPLSIAGLALGSYTIVVKKPPGKDWTSKVTLAAGTTLVRAEIAASMPKLPTEGELEIQSTPAGAEVWVDGGQLGVTPVNITLQAGDRWIQVKLQGHVTFETRRPVEAGKKLELNVQLVRAGELKVSSVPAGSTVFIDGVRRGVTPLVLELAHGMHTVWIERAGYQRFEQKVKLDDKPIEITATLKR